MPKLICKKVSYKGRKMALHHLHRILNTPNTFGDKKPQRAYQCELCGKWHLTSKAKDDDKHIDYKLTLDWSSVCQP